MATEYKTLGAIGRRQPGYFQMDATVAAGDSLIVRIPPGVSPTVGVAPAAGGTATVSDTPSGAAKIDAGTADWYAWDDGDIVNPATARARFDGVVRAVKIDASGGAVAVSVAG